ncbi:MAG: leucine-rich repeat protein [Acutalibacteraceae bacterium]
MSVKTRLKTLIARLADALTAKGVEASAEETLTALVDKVGNIEIGQGGSIPDNAAIAITAYDNDGNPTAVRLKGASYYRAEMFGSDSWIRTPYFNLEICEIDDTPITYVGARAFGITALRRFDFTKVQAASIGQSAFSAPLTDQHSITLSPVTTSIGYTVFAKSEVETITLLGAVKLSGTNAANSPFSSCNNLNTVQLGSADNAVASINAYTFASCPALTSLTVYTADGQPLENSPFGAENATVEYIQA